MSIEIKVIADSTVAQLTGISQFMCTHCFNPFNFETSLNMHMCMQLSLIHI